MKQMNKKCVIFSGEHKDVSEEMNKVSTLCIRRYLEENNYSFKTLNGYYEGHSENSFLVELTDESETLDDIVALARLYGQDTILLLDEDRNATLRDVDHDTIIGYKNLGKLVPITSLDARKLDAWSYCSISDQFYGIVA